MKLELHGDAPERCLWKSGQKYQCISTTVEHGGRTVIVWGDVLAAGNAELLHCEKSFNVFEYRRVLQNAFLPTIEMLLSKEK